MGAAVGGGPPAALYLYGRSATGLPLLQFLAFYQVLEYYFPIYSKMDVLSRVKSKLRDPRFDRADDADVNRLIGLASQVGKGGASEKEQLRLTVGRDAGIGDT